MVPVHLRRMCISLVVDRKEETNPLQHFAQKLWWRSLVGHSPGGHRVGWLSWPSPQDGWCQVFVRWVNAVLPGDQFVFIFLWMDPTYLFLSKLYKNFRKLAFLNIPVANSESLTVCVLLALGSSAAVTSCMVTVQSLKWMIHTGDVLRVVVEIRDQLCWEKKKTVTCVTCWYLLCKYSTGLMSHYQHDVTNLYREEMCMQLPHTSEC